MRLLVLLAVVAMAFFAARSAQNRDRGSHTSNAARPRPVAEPGKFVSLVIDYGDGHQRQFDALPWHQGMTVDDLLAAAAKQPDGISYDVVDEHDKMFLTRIDAVGNYPRAGRPIWTYRVNEQRGDRSLGVYELEPGDRVVWTFGPQQNRQKN